MGQEVIASQRAVSANGAARRPLRRDHLPLGLAIGLIVLVGLDLRPGIVSMGPLLIPLRAAFRLSHAGAALLTAIPDVLMGLLAVLAPGLARRFGRDRVILAALALLAATTAGRAFAGSAAALFLATAGVGAGIAVAGALVGGFVKASFPDRPALLMGFYTGALSLGSTLAASLTGPLAAWRGWRWGAGGWALLGIGAIAAWLVVARRADDVAVPMQPHRLPFRDGKAWLIALFFAAQNFLFYSLVSWLVALYRERGVDATAAGLILASFTGVFFLANLTSGAISRTPDRRRWLAAFATLALVGLALLASAPTLSPFVVVTVIAIGLGGCFTLGITLPLDNTRDPDEANAWGAFMTLVAYLIASAGPIAVGALRDATHSFGSPLWLLVAAGAAMLGLTPFLKPRRLIAGRTAASARRGTVAGPKSRAKS